MPSRAAPAATKPAPAETRRRPGCVTAFVVILFIAAAIAALAFLVSALSSLANGLRYMPADVVAIVLFLALFATALFFAAFGLVRMRTWGRMLAMVLSGLIALASLGVLIWNLTTQLYAGRDQMTLIGVLLVPMLVSGYVYYWFLDHPRLFG